MLTSRRTCVAVTLAVVAAGALMLDVERVTAREQVTSLLSTSKTILGQPIAYPTQSSAKVSSAVVVMQPGDETGWHQHDVPMFGYILEGEITVDYGAKGTHVYRQGDALIEAVDLPHNGRNTGKGEARILAVFMGADGVPNTEMLPAPTATPQ